MRRPLHFGLQQKCFMHISLFITPNINKSFTQGLRFNIVFTSRTFLSKTGNSSFYVHRVNQTLGAVLIVLIGGIALICATSAAILPTIVFELSVQMLTQ